MNRTLAGIIVGAIVLVAGVLIFKATRVPATIPVARPGPVVAAANSAPVPAVVPPVVPAAPVSEAVQMQVSEAIQAQLARDFDKADRLFVAALAAEPKLKGIVYQRAVVAFNREDFTAAATLAADSIARKEELSACHILLGTMAGLRKDHAGALAEFERAAAASPADAMPFYNASESLRNLGRPAEAADKLRDAIQRNPGDPLYAFKLRLARIEAGEERDMEADIRQQLAVRPPAGDWILTAAAISLKNERLTEAAGLISAAKQVMQPQLFFTLIQDPLFARFKARPEIAPFYDVTISQTPPKS